MLLQDGPGCHVHAHESGSHTRQPAKTSPKPAIQPAVYQEIVLVVRINGYPELKSSRKTEPQKGFAYKLHRQARFPYIISSMNYPVLINRSTKNTS